MSWSCHLIGKAPRVAEAVVEALAKVKCSEPEESIKTKVGEIVAASIAAMPEAAAVKIEAMGSQSQAYDSAGKTVPGKVTNSLTLKIEPIWGFVE